MKPKTWSLIIISVINLALFNSNVYAQYYFGRNKIQYDNFQWKILKTKHFDIYFYPEMRELAEIGAAFAEDAYSRLENKLNHDINRTIPLILYSNHSHFQQTNTISGHISEGVGGFFEFLKGRVVIPSNGSIHDFKHVINHELVHVFTRSRMHRILKDHRRMRFRGLPLWFTEGIAEYWSEGWDSQAEMIIRDAVINDHLVPLSEMDSIYGTFLMYKEGQAVCKYIAENFGEEKLQQLIENIWKEDSFSKVMKLTIGLNYKQFDQRWIYDLKKSTYLLLQECDSPEMVSKTITKNGINTKAACFTKDGKNWAVFVANRVGYSNIYLKSLDHDSQKPEVLIKGERTAAFESLRLLRSKIDVNDRGELIFVSKSGPRDVIYLYDIEKRKILRKLQFQDLVSLSSPNWSPDGERIVFSGINYAGLRDLYFAEVESGQLQRLTFDFYDDRDPAWSPDGRTIVFSSDRSYFGKEGYSNLCIYDLHGSNIEYLTMGAHNDNSPAWSPNGEYIAFSSDRDGSFNIWMIKNNGASTQTLLDQNNGHNGNKGYNEGHEGGRINGHDGFSSRNSPAAIPTTNHLKKVTNLTTGVFDPAWLDNERLLFTAYEKLAFQIREINQLDKSFEMAAVMKNDTLVSGQEPWTANELAGEVVSTSSEYKNKFSLDITQGAISYDPVSGTTGGAQVALSDMLGNHRYYFMLFNNGQTKREFLTHWNVAITRVNLSRRTNYAFGGYRLTGRFYDWVDSYFERTQLGGFVAASHPFSVFQRIEGAMNIRRERKVYDIRGETINGMIISTSISYIKDNAIWGYTGPIDGERFNFTLGQTTDIQHKDVNFYTIIMDYRRYFRLSRRMTYAFRLMTRFNHGKEAFRSFIGGSWNLRLYPNWTIWGRKLFLVNHEFRFPFIDRFLVGFPIGGLGFNGIGGALFLDFGQAGDRKAQFNHILGSLGFGLRLRLGGFIVLRFEIGKRFQVRSLSRPRLVFEDGVKKAFWFGFDF